MEYEIGDDPQGEQDYPEGDRTGGIARNHRALKNQSSVQPGDCPAKDREAASLVNSGNHKH